tara:strand:- start:11782 stop:12060 length:279 start_codon:yes stop_codon:yes gene_type:complete
VFSGLKRAVFEHGTHSRAWRQSVKIGDLVIVRKGHYDFNGRGIAGKSSWAWADHLGVITDARPHRLGTAEYKVYTADNKHSWEHVSDLRIPD